MTRHDGREPCVEICRLGGPTKGAIGLICLPYAGGGVSVFRGWPRILPATIQVYALSLPGREGRILEPPFTELGPLLDSAVRALLPLVRHPFAVFGHSMGGLVAFELVRELQKHHSLTPTHLFVSGFRAPHCPDPRPLSHDLPRHEFIDELRRLNGTAFDPSEHPELIDLMLPTLRADFRMVQTYCYRHEPPVRCPITAYGGSGDKDVGEEQLQGWREHTSAAFTLKMLPGDHFFLHAAERLLLQEISRQLNCHR